MKAMRFLFAFAVCLASLWLLVANNAGGTLYALAFVAGTVWLFFEADRAIRSLIARDTGEQCYSCGAASTSLVELRDTTYQRGRKLCLRCAGERGL